MQLNYFKDARYFQIIFQIIFLLYGIFYLHWNTEWWLYGTYFTTSICTQFIGEIFKKNTLKKFSPAWWKKIKMGMPSALISSFGLSLLLKTNHIEIAAMAAFVSIVSK